LYGRACPGSHTQVVSQKAYSLWESYRYELIRREKVHLGYIDGLTDALFKLDRDGKDIFYPHGILGKGYVLPNSAKKEEVRGFLKRFYLVSLLLILLTGSTVGWAANVILIPPLLLWYYLRVKRLLKEVMPTAEKLKFSEAASNSAKSHNLFTLWFLEVCSLLFVLSGLLILFIAPQKWFIGLMSVVFFGACAFSIGYMILARGRTAPRTSR
jgi:NADH:ubiquinone oxidoreductase subunit 3 (subunit A)